MKKKKVKSKKLQYTLAVLIVAILIIICVALFFSKPLKDVFSGSKIKGIIIGNTTLLCGDADSICPSEYAGCKECNVPDSDCENVC